MNDSMMDGTMDGVSEPLGMGGPGIMGGGPGMMGRGGPGMMRGGRGGGGMRGGDRGPMGQRSQDVSPLCPRIFKQKPWNFLAMHREFQNLIFSTSFGR